jgi:mRNA (guanine-N7-)-methyltransferase
MSKTIEENYAAPQLKSQSLEGAHRVNNYIKAKLIQDHLLVNGQVLDMPCGKGGDLKKYRQNKASFYMGVDLVPANVVEARRRHEATRCMFGAHFMEGDFTQQLDLASQYDIVSCMFALHYAWDTEARARQVMKNAAERLKANGTFLITVPDFTEILDRLVRMTKHQNEHNYAKKHGDGTYTYRIGEAHYWLEFKSDMSFTGFFDSLRTTPYGHKYIYYHEGAVDQVPEYLVEPKELTRIAGLEGLRIVSSDNFRTFVERPDKRLASQMKCNLDLAEEGRSLVSLYKAIVLRHAKRRRD